MTLACRAVAALSSEISLQRRLLALRSPENFGLVYLGHYLEHPPSALHRRLYQLLGEAGSARGARIAVAAPRGHAKSTVVSLIYPLWALLSGAEPLTLLLSATRDQAASHLRNIRSELETNERLLMDFPELAAIARGRRPKPWRGNALHMPGGAMIRALGAGEQIRGARHRQHRPSMIICDDLEAPERVVSAEQRAQLCEWFTKTLLKAGDAGTNVVLIGTVLHYDSLLARYTAHRPQPGWQAEKFQALNKRPDDEAAWQRWQSIYAGHDEWDGRGGREAALAYFRANEQDMLAGAEVLWPEREPLYELMEMMVREGRAAFDSEKQNEPLDPEQCLFRPGSFHFWDEEFANTKALLGAIGREARVSIAWDPSMGASQSRGDYSAIVVVAHDRGPDLIYVLAADLERRPPDQSIKRLVQYAQMFKPTEIGVERNGFQELLQRDLSDALRRAHCHGRVHALQNTGDKRSRIGSLQPRIEHGQLVFSARQSELLEQLRQFPLGRHDDGPDALEMACRLIHMPWAQVYT